MTRIYLQLPAPKARCVRRPRKEWNTQARRRLRIPALPLLPKDARCSKNRSAFFPFANVPSVRRLASTQPQLDSLPHATRVGAQFGHAAASFNAAARRRRNDPIRFFRIFFRVSRNSKIRVGNYFVRKMRGTKREKNDWPLLCVRKTFRGKLG